MPALQIAADDGSLRRKVMVIERTTYAVVVAFNKEGEDHHYTYHADGSVHERAAGRREVLLPPHSPLNQFRNVYQLPGWGLAKTLVEQKEPKSRANGPHKETVLDVAPLLNNALNLSVLVLLIEPHREDLVEKILARFKTPLVSYAWREITPWVLAIVLGTRAVVASQILVQGGRVNVIQVSDRPWL